MKPHLRLLLSIAAFAAIPASPALADCPDKPYKCDFGFIGGQGTCWKTWRCVPCGDTRCPALPATTFRNVPKRAEFACIDHAVNSGQTNGCSNPSPDPASGFYRNYFKPACDQHDLCYLNTNGLSKRQCDDDFKTNMEWMCDRYFTGALNVAQRGSCRAAAGTWWAVLASDIKSTTNYTEAQAWSRAQCSPPAPPVPPETPAPTPPTTPGDTPNPGGAPKPVADSKSAGRPFSPGVYRAQHPHWGGTVTLNPDGSYARDNGDPGTWSFDGTNLVLNWKNWGPEGLTLAGRDSYRSANGFTLDLQTPAFIPGTYRAAHPHWGGVVTFNADGSYARDTGDPGRWTFDGTTLTLNWTNWGAEPVVRAGVASYRSSTTRFSLDLIRPHHVAGTYRAQHPHWGGTVTLKVDGTFARDNGDPGTWECDGTSLTLHWTRWGPEALTRVGPSTYRNPSGFTLER
jgi:hypothetical protein